MAGIVVVGWRYRGVVANSHEHWLSPPVSLWQLSFIELMGSMLAKTGSHGSGVGRRVPEMRRIVEFNCASTSPVWAERHHTGAQYSPAE